MKNTIKLVMAALVITLAACNSPKPGDNPDTDGKDSMATDTTASTIIPADTTSTLVTQDSTTAE
jgi:uncharacterized lipoprotein